MRHQEVAMADALVSHAPLITGRPEVSEPERRDVARRHVSVNGLGEEDLAKHAVTPEERSALTAGDVDALYRLGANPYLIRRVFRGRFRI
jgi:hypothetical protein